MRNGFIKVHRKIMDWEWYTSYPEFKLFTHLLLKANHDDQKWRGEVIKRGSCVTSLASLSVETGLSVQQVRTALKNLKSTQELTSIGRNRNTLIIVVNYNLYQDINMIDNNQLTINQQSTNNQLTTNKNVKNVKNDKNIKESVKEKFSPPTLTDLNSYCLEKNLNVDTERFLNYYTSNGWMVGRNKMKDWRATLRNWSKDTQPVQPSIEPNYDTSVNQTYSQKEIEERMSVLRNEM